MTRPRRSLRSEAHITSFGHEDTGTQAPPFTEDPSTSQVTTTAITTVKAIPPLNIQGARSSNPVITKSEVMLTLIRGTQIAVSQTSVPLILCGMPALNNINTSMLASAPIKLHYSTVVATLPLHNQRRNTGPYTAEGSRLSRDNSRGTTYYPYIFA